jgi:hypothetical protein
MRKIFIYYTYIIDIEYSLNTIFILIICLKSNTIKELTIYNDNNIVGPELYNAFIHDFNNYLCIIDETSNKLIIKFNENEQIDFNFKKMVKNKCNKIKYD